MNCPIRVDPEPDEGHNQNPSDLAPEINTNNTLNHRKNSTDGGRNKAIHLGDGSHDAIEAGTSNVDEDGAAKKSSCWTGVKSLGKGVGGPGALLKWRNKIVKYSKFVGPGFMVSVAYIDPGNYATDVAGGASYQFKLLFIILLSNIFAIFLQSLCIKLGTVTGMNLAECCKAYCPPWLNYILYFFAESAIIATDIAEVIGTAIALNVLLNIPLVAGCAISIVDVLIILIFYNPTGMSMRALRLFELFVALLVLGVVVCFCFQLSLIQNTKVGDVFRGYLPSSAIVEKDGLYQSCGILGATVMPHSLYLGSGIVQNRLRDFDKDHQGGNESSQQSGTSSEGRVSTDTQEEKYRPSLAAIKSCLNYSIIELAFSLFTFALFVNSAILITAGASLYGNDAVEDADLFSIHDLLSRSLAPAAGTVFALALLLSGTSAGIVCTIAGQMVSEGQLNWHVKPWVRRIITRSISITPSIIIAGAVGRKGLSAALEASQVCLSVILPFVSAPLIWFTCRSKFMTVYTEDRAPASNTTPTGDEGGDKRAAENTTDAAATTSETAQPTRRFVVMRNHWVTAGLALLIWGVIVVMNVALLVLVGLGKE